MGMALHAGPEGMVDWKALMGLLRQRGYSGLVSFEDFSALSSKEKIVPNLSYIKSLL